MAKITVYEDAAGEWRFRAQTRNGEIIAQSEGYEALRDALAGAEILRDAPWTIEVERKT